jgi:tetraacyldisaccharide 4'-kinase
LLSASEFRALVSGQTHGIKAAVLRSGLRLAEIPYSLAVRWRNHRYDTGGFEVQRVPVPVVSVGNLTLGGTGKTPMVEWLARWFRLHGLRVALISRGYGAEAGSANDEALELKERLPDVPHIQNPDRVEAARLAVAEYDSQIIVLDDAFQHRRIARDLDIVLLDALEPFGFGHVFPRGTLREPLSGLRRADVVVLSRSGMLAPAARETLRRQVARLAPKARWAEVDHGPQSLRNASGQQQPTQSLAEKAVAAFCGVGNPAGFRHTLQLCGYRVIALREFADHYRYTRADVESLVAWANALDVEAVLCTHKDLVKLRIDTIGRRPLWAMTIALELFEGRADLEAKLARLASV